ncbi:hypothetical protein GGI35DRAFT_7993 [Trichoderma velutinum]
MYVGPQKLRGGGQARPYLYAPSQAIDRDSVPRIQEIPKCQCPRLVVGSRKSGGVLFYLSGFCCFVFSSRYWAPSKKVHSNTTELGQKTPRREGPSILYAVCCFAGQGRQSHRHHAETGQRLTYKQNIIPSCLFQGLPTSSSRPAATLQGRSLVRKPSSGDDIVRLLPHVSSVQPLQCLNDTLVRAPRPSSGLD